MSTQASTRRGPQTVSLNDEEGVRRIVVDTVFGLWGMVNNLTRLRPSKRERYRVTIFGSARIKPDSWVYEEVKRLSGALAGMGCDIVTGGGPGLMQAVSDGAQVQGAGELAQSVGIRVDLPFEQEVNPFVQ
jgi:predicted Rossmann-fold nucleotide-binding protein